MRTTKLLTTNASVVTRRYPALHGKELVLSHHILYTNTIPKYSYLRITIRSFLWVEVNRMMGTTTVVLRCTFV